MKKCLSLLLLFILPTLSFAQLEEQWKKTYGGNRSDQINAVIQNYAGDYVFVGQSGSLDDDGKISPVLEKRTRGNDDIFFGIIGTDGTAKELKAIGRSGKENASGITQTFDGGYAISGFTNSKDKKNANGGKDLWLVKLDTEGKFLWEYRAGTAKNDAINAVIQLKNGNLAATGYKDKELWVGCFDQEGNLIWEKKSKHNSFGNVGNDLVQLEDESIIITGFAGSQKSGSKSKILMWRLSETGKQLDRPQEFGKGYDKGIRIDVFDNEIYSLNNLYNPSSKSEPHIIPLTKQLEFKGEQSWEFNHSDDERPYAFLKSALDKHFYLAGGSSNSGYRRDFFLLKIDSTGKSVWEDRQYFGGDFTDDAYDMIETFEGNILLAGKTFSNKKFGGTSDGWMIKLKGSDFPTSQKAQISVSNIAFVEPSGDDYLQPGERGYIVFDLKNTGDSDAYQIAGKVTASNGKNLRFPRTLKYGHLPAKTTRRFSLPIAGMKGLKNGECDFTLNFSERSGSQINPIRQTIKTRLKPEVKLEFAQPEWIFAGEKPKTEQPITLKLKIKNTGEIPATNLSGVFSYEKNIIGASDKDVKEEKLAPGAETTFEFTFKINQVFRGDSARIGFRYKASEEGYRFDAYKNFGLFFEPEILLPALTISEPNFSPKKTEFDPEEEITLSYTLKNSGNVDFSFFDGTFVSDASIDFLSPKDVKLDLLKMGESKDISIKFKPKKDFNARELVMRLNYKTDIAPYDSERAKDVVVKFEKQLPNLVISKFEVVRSQGVYERNKKIDLTLTVTNNGRGNARNVELGIKPQTGINLASKQKSTIDKIAGGTNETKTFSILISPEFKGSEAQIIGYFKEGLNDAEQLLKIKPEGNAPFLAIEGFKILSPTPVPLGKDLKIQFLVKNTGGQPSEAIDWKMIPSSNIVLKK